MRAMRPVCLAATPSTVSSTGWPTRMPAASRSGTASRSRSGCDAHQDGHRRAGRQVVAGVDQPLADGAVEGRRERRSRRAAAGDGELAPALREERLAGAGGLDRLLVAPLGDAEVGVGGVEVRAWG